MYRPGDPYEARGVFEVLPCGEEIPRGSPVFSDGEALYLADASRPDRTFFGLATCGVWREGSEVRVLREGVMLVEVDTPAEPGPARVLASSYETEGVITGADPSDVPGAEILPLPGVTLHRQIGPFLWLAIVTQARKPAPWLLHAARCAA